MPSASPTPFASTSPGYWTPVNPECASPVDNATVVLPTDMLFPCVNASECAPGGAFYSSTANCDNWFCSLRVNCDCFAGMYTGCNANLTNSGVTLKPNCWQLASMFAELECSWEPYLGPRSEQSAYQGYLDTCMDGCFNPAAPAHSVSALAAALSLIAASAVLA